MNAKVTTTTTDITDAAERQFSPGKLALVSQAAGCHQRLAALVPEDQERLFTARWVNGNTLEFVEVDAVPAVADTPDLTAALAGDGPATVTDDEKAKAEQAAKAAARAEAVRAAKGKLHNVSNANLQEMAARLGVPWDAQDSRDTRLQKIAEAQVDKDAATPPAP